MTEQNLIHCGFKKKTLGDYYWFELKVKGSHAFITNDRRKNFGKDVWYIGYQHKQEDAFWFNQKLLEEAVFKIIFHTLTGVEFKLAHQRNLIR